MTAVGFSAWYMHDNHRWTRVAVSNQAEFGVWGPWHWLICGKVADEDLSRFLTDWSNAHAVDWSRNRP